MKLYDSLQSSPLFQGLTSDNLLQIIGQTKFTFRKIAAGDIIKKEGEQCNRLALVVNGQAKSIAYADDHGYSIEENVAAPYTLQPECMFGLQLHYTRTFIATTTCDIVEIDKDDLMRISDEFIIFRMNLVNYISALSQKTTRKLWHPIPADAHDRIVHFIKTHCSSPTGPKTMRIKMTRLAQETGLGRRAVSEILNTMQDENLLTFSRGIIEINHIEALT
ncbi:MULTISPECIES: Crp/Fnr family transcriptional regulator [Prevotellaceae]|jgi:CRP-like cAMP-binding protein|uniref:Crp/Fnr family transcriptional regulator n=1 Tax=Leyella stercorea TaxID=363265 RepID=UPI001F196124|nr:MULTISPECIES: Crp/Fnr family transcriptional regulator [Prevotellaceae]MCF2644747.1 Crp/Fnr family transcriptional regulator [Leyella stercorea]MCI7371953.1 Crp/Fnr family transcriptional regulator [Prevotella sp.]MDD6198745.1 Crp/Fnr family transcriptional regulator [Prevotella sp.]MDY3968189.1 Crp/Fnr family transcriptional regulator [Prevotella sp.]